MASPSLDKFPQELLWLIFDLLDVKTLGILRGVCQELKTRTNVLWQCHQLSPLFVRLNPDNPTRVHLRPLPEWFKCRAQVREYQALQASRHLVFQLPWAKFVCNGEELYYLNCSIIEAGLLALGRNLIDRNDHVDRTALHSLTFFASSLQEAT
ncbi:uncharacterized protein BO97DRAFT_428477 [Aspergillus homomorphus CBS 101889]|uniref:F-box domain-containing protein n=1 Tax=Aspergillus homomorphus (strain CBS 101889) TaxID=1450537 RepID=A0A395HNC4_ASPHC|nr:hypothetical protein BO97DRAFT_428477 [Aspergillus homomorphus CBS 101889]RAL08338.1 hypothetical protein BO97DRAFT_428477 [Aspergillus homomorphus CBS 101889]